MLRGRGPTARVLPEWIWARVETRRPSLTQLAATQLINELLGPAARPITPSWYRMHAALRQWQRLRLAAAEPAAQHHTPAEPAAASSAASIDSELGAVDSTPHACDHADAAGGTHSPSHPPTDTPAESVSGSPPASPASRERLDSAAAELTDDCVPVCLSVRSCVRVRVCVCALAYACVHVRACVRACVRDAGLQGNPRYRG